ncbi:MAG TPA: YidC/Oxa1 family membrane protein insertase [Candidatus Baltobacteraceae bacterium]|nr:YidC/Oxa1 family membrane protein insertase [Candidatus Baltobacteraceae bacterium]
MHLLLAGWLDPIVFGMSWLVNEINIPLHNLGLSLVTLALILRVFFWPLNAKQFSSMMAMQKVAPKIKALQTKYKGDNQKIQQETMALYKSEGVNPLAGCLPMLVQYPFLISVFYMVIQHKELYAHTSFLWVGSALAAHTPKIFGVALFAPSLAQADAVLLVLYGLSMYLSIRFGTMPATDPSQAQTQKMMAFLSPAMLFFIGFKYAWPSALVLYWLCSNLFQMGQQLYMLRRFHEPLSFLDSTHVITENIPPAAAAPAALTSGNGASKRKNKKGAKS